MTLDVVPLKICELRKRGLYWRELDPKQSTEFTYCRFFVPYLNEYNGWALFCDDDFLWLGDVAELFSLCDDRFALMCVKHDYCPKSNSKLGGKIQETYPRKNWSSMMLINCSHPANAALDLRVVNSQPGSYLHRFSWLEDDLIGGVNYEWNFLVGWHERLPGSLPKAIHYTEGGPWFPDYREVDYAEEWFTHMTLYEKSLQRPRELCPNELFTLKGRDPLLGYVNSK